jgi:hypothetical protein
MRVNFSGCTSPDFGGQLGVFINSVKNFLNSFSEFELLEIDADVLFMVFVSISDDLEVNKRFAMKYDHYSRFKNPKGEWERCIGLAIEIPEGVLIAAKDNRVNFEMTLINALRERLLHPVNKLPKKIDATELFDLLKSKMDVYELILKKSYAG